MAITAEITLQAALRDLFDRREATHEVATRNLAPALLNALGHEQPTAIAPADHPQAPAVFDALLRAQTERRGHADGYALIGLGMIGHANAHTLAMGLLHDTSADAWPRECAALALSYAHEAGAGSPRQREEAVRALSAALDDACDAVRYQVASSLAALTPDRFAPLLITRLQSEPHPRVRAQLVALARVVEWTPALADALRPLVDDAEPAVAVEAALALAAHGDEATAPRLLWEVSHGERRDDALEALAWLGRARGLLVDEGALVRLESLVARPWVHGRTRARAAFALSSLSPARGERAMTRLERSLRASVRRAAREARALQRALEGADGSGPGTADAS